MTVEAPGQPVSALTVARTAGGGRIVVQAWLASRALIAAVALLLAVVTGRSLTGMVSNWDVQHFTELAAGGYLAKDDGTLMAFFPGLPGLLALGLRIGLPVAVTGVVVSLVCSAVAAGALYRLGGPWAAVVWLFAPTAVFTVVPYTESLFCAAAFWAWERARADRWVAGAVLTAVACAVRVSGLFLIGALLVMIVTSRGVPLRDKAQRAALLAFPVSVLGLFATYLHGLTGSWTAWYHAQSTGWVRGFTWPWDSFRNTLPAIAPGAYADHPWWAAVFRGEMVSMVVGLLVVLWCLVPTQARRARGQRPQWAEASWIGVQVLAFSLSYWFFSVNRATLLWFPLWVMLARWGSGRVSGVGSGTGDPAGSDLSCATTRTVPRSLRRGLVIAGLGVETALMLGWSWLFFTGHWAS